ncbi:hypothetical protein E6O75_ATG07420 [Venturia nashicola]|uniref:CFEM domain-containing protein n=1 Tax=Venturia nashicola TaxID=86259 RepID=A0A4Z1P642_9PEZI|nr:hypothetical protein E6O75_ATG07420 [Venturia nashicola]
MRLFILIAALTTAISAQAPPPTQNCAQAADAIPECGKVCIEKAADVPPINCAHLDFSCYCAATTKIEVTYFFSYFTHHVAFSLYHIDNPRNERRPFYRYLRDNCVPSPSIAGQGDKLIFSRDPSISHRLLHYLAISTHLSEKSPHKPSSLNLEP